MTYKVKFQNIFKDGYVSKTHGCTIDATSPKQAKKWLIEVQPYFTRGLSSVKILSIKKQTNKIKNY